MNHFVLSKFLTTYLFYFFKLHRRRDRGRQNLFLFLVSKLFQDPQQLFQTFTTPLKSHISVLLPFPTTWPSQGTLSLLQRKQKLPIFPNSHPQICHQLQPWAPPSLRRKKPFRQILCSIKCSTCNLLFLQGACSIILLSPSLLPQFCSYLFPCSPTSVYTHVQASPILKGTLYPPLSSILNSFFLFTVYLLTRVVYTL